jgi:hypothetical protein
MDFDDEEEGLHEGLLTWLRSLDKDALTRILASRPDTLEAPWPRRLDDLARRLDNESSVMLALRQVPLPGLQWIRAVQLCWALDGDAPHVATVADQLGVSEPEVAGVLDPLCESALAWVDKTGAAQLPDALQGAGYVGYHLGLPLTVVLQDTTADHLKRLTGRLGLPSSGRKQQLIDRLLAYFRDRDKVRELVNQAPDDARELLLDGAWHGPVVDCDISFAFYVNRLRRDDQVESATEWAVNRGLIWPEPDGIGYLPLEVGLALRGPGYRLPFTPEPPTLSTMPVAPDHVAAECSAAALRLIDRTLTVVDAAAASPIPLLKSGRVGVRAIKAIAKNTGATAEEIRLVVELAIATSLLAPVEPPPPPVSRGRKGRSRSRQPEPPPAPEGLVPTENFADWRDSGSAPQLRILLGTWWKLQQTPLADEKAIRDVLGGDPSAAFADIRQRAVRLLTEQAEGVGVTDGLVELVGWRTPMLVEELLEPLLNASLAEAALLGVTASGAAGELARALVEGSAEVDDPRLVKATDALVAGARTSALFGSDLTAIVTGPVDAKLAGLLDRAATRESQGSASSWRFSPESVRNAFDNGVSAADLLDQLGSVAEGPLPQPLVYLVNDVARRHGELGVLDVRCVVVAENTALLTEIAVNRRLAELGLRQIAPTVLTAGAPATETLNALRKAGYAPVARDSDGTIVVAGEQFASPAPAAVTDAGLVASFDGHLFHLAEPEGLVQRWQAPDPAEHAARLLREPAPTARPVTRGDLTGALYREHGDRLSPEWMQFAWTLEAGMPVRVDYREPNGETRRIRISRPELDGDTIDVWCSEDRDYRQLELTRIVPISIR